MAKDQAGGAHPTPPPFDVKTRCIKVRGGKLYLQVSDRLMWLNAEREALGYEVEIMSDVVHYDHEHGVAVVKTTVRVPGRGQGCGIKSETRAGFANFLEKAQTGSLGRALAQIGFGTEYALEFREEDIQEGGEISQAVDTPRAAPARTEGHTLTTSAGGATLVQKAGATLATTPPGQDAAADQRKVAANQEIKRLAKEHGYTPPTSYGALVKLAQDQYGYTLPKVAGVQQITPEVLEEFVEHMKHVGGDPLAEGAAQKGETTTGPFDRAPHDAQDPAAVERYARAIADVRRALDAYSVPAQLDDVIALVRRLHAEGCVRTEDRMELEEQHARRVRETLEAKAAKSA